MPKTVAEELVEKTFKELAQAKKPQQRSRISQAPNGYIFLVSWSNASLLRVFVRRFTDTLTRWEHRLKAQLDDAARSVVANIEEGFGRPTTAEYLTFLGYSQASLIEVKGDIQRARQDGFLPSVSGSSLAGLGIDLSAWHEALKHSVISRPAETRGGYRNLGGFRGKDGRQYETRDLSKVSQNRSRFLILQTPLNSFKFLYNPVDNLRVDDLTYEIFIELINKTDWHLRRLVASLEDKLNRDQKFYQVEKARVRSNLRMK